MLFICFHLIPVLIILVIISVLPIIIVDVVRLFSDEPIEGVREVSIICTHVSVNSYQPFSRSMSIIACVRKQHLFQFLSPGNVVIPSFVWILKQHSICSFKETSSIGLLLLLLLLGVLGCITLRRLHLGLAHSEKDKVSDRIAYVCPDSMTLYVY